MLSLWQPWASLCVWKNPDNGKAEKQIETRHWSTDYRGLIAIHATKTLTPQARFEIANNSHIQDALIRHGAVDFGSVKRVTLTVGAIIGVVELAEIYTTENILVNFNFFTMVASEAKREKAFGNYEPNRFGWLFKNPIEFKTPIECRGLQSLGSPKPEIEALIFEQLSNVR